MVWNNMLETDSPNLSPDGIFWKPNKILGWDMLGLLWVHDKIFWIFKQNTWLGYVLGYGGYALAEYSDISNGSLKWYMLGLL